MLAPELVSFRSTAQPISDAVTPELCAANNVTGLACTWPSVFTYAVSNSPAAGSCNMAKSTNTSTSVLPTVVFPGREDREPTVHVLTRSAEAGDFPSLVGAALKDDRLTDLVEAGGRLPAEGFGAFREHLESGPLEADATIASLTHFDLW